MRLPVGCILYSIRRWKEKENMTTRLWLNSNNAIMNLSKYFSSKPNQITTLQ